jgi:toxin ParE1/3/4
VKYRISDKAIEDINSIWLYTLENWPFEQADKYYRFIYQIITSIPNNFEKGKDIGNIKFGYRQIKVKSHYIIYKKAEDGIVEIIRVLHEKMDILNRL